MNLNEYSLRGMNLRVAMFSPVFYPDVSGLSNHVLLLAKELLDQGCEVLVYTCSSDRTKSPQMETIDGVRVWRFDSKSDFFVYDVSRKLSVCLDEYKPNIVHFHCLLSGLAALLTEKPKETKFVVTLHTLWDENREYYLPNLISDIQEVQRVILSSDKIDQYIVVSQFLKEIATDNGCPSSRISVVYNGVDFSMFDSKVDFTRANFGPDRNSDFVNILILSRISPEKGIVEFVKEFPKAVEKCPNLRLFIVGSHEPNDYIRVRYFNELVRCVNDNPLLQKCVNLIGGVPYNKVPEFLFLSDILVMPSLHEGLSMAMIEGMAVGKPVIAFNLGAGDELIKSGFNGILVKPMNYIEMIEKIILLARDPNFGHKLGWNAYKTAMQKFSSRKMGEETVHIYKKLLQ